MLVTLSTFKIISDALYNDPGRKLIRKKIEKMSSRLDTLIAYPILNDHNDTNFSITTGSLIFQTLPNLPPTPTPHTLFKPPLIPPHDPHNPIRPESILLYELNYELHRILIMNAIVLMFSLS